jgi:hypothetical protein
MTNDVEKRWHDPPALRAAALYTAVVFLLAVAAFVGYALHDRNSVAWAVATPAVLAVGAIGAFLKTYRDWRAGRTWPIWHGAGWFLLTLTMLGLAVPAMGFQG